MAKAAPADSNTPAPSKSPKRIVSPLFAGTDEDDSNPIYVDDIGRIRLYRVVTKQGKKKRLLIPSDKQQIEIDAATTTEEDIIAAYPEWDEFYIEACAADTGHFIRGSGHTFYANVEEPEGDEDEDEDERGPRESRSEMMTRLQMEREDRPQREDPTLAMLKEQTRAQSEIMQRQLEQAQRAPNDSLNMAKELIAAVAPAKGEASAEDLYRLRREADELRVENRRMLVANDSKLEEVKEEYRQRARALEKSNDADRQRFDEEVRRLRMEMEDNRRRSNNELDELRKKGSKEYDEMKDRLTRDLDTHKERSWREYEALKQKADVEIERLKNEIHKLKNDLAQTVDMSESKPEPSGNQNKPWWVDDFLGPAMENLGKVFESGKTMEEAATKMEQRLRSEMEAKYAAQFQTQMAQMRGGSPPPGAVAPPASFSQPQSSPPQSLSSPPSPLPPAMQGPPAASETHAVPVANGGMTYGRVFTSTSPGSSPPDAPRESMVIVTDEEEDERAEVG